MAPVKRLDALRASMSAPPHHDQVALEDDADAMSDFEAEMKKLAAANQELLGDFHPPEDDGSQATAAQVDSEELELLRLENAELKAAIEEWERRSAISGEDQWRERQREYEVLLEEKSEIIRSLHQQIEEIQESAIGGPSGPSPSSMGMSASRMGQAEEILRLKRELEEQRRQLDQDEEDMTSQMRQMEMAMAKERAEMARQRQEVTRLQGDLAREIEQSSRNGELRDRLSTLRRGPDAKPTQAAPAAEADQGAQKNSGLLRRLFG